MLLYSVNSRKTGIDRLGKRRKSEGECGKVAPHSVNTGKIRIFARMEDRWMFDKFGEFDSYEEINELAENLFNEGDMESLKAMAGENGIQEEIVEVYMLGELPMLCDPLTAAIGKIEVEAVELKPKEIMEDWVEYLKGQCMENEETALAVRRKGRSLKGCIGELLKWSFKNQIGIDKDILKAAGVTASRVTLGIPGMGRAKKIIRDYYTGK
jgi:hypothetical protein